MSDLIEFKKEVIQLLKDADRKDIDLSLILQLKEEEDTAQEVFEKLIEKFPEKKVFVPRKRMSEEEYATRL